jgi:hypothetical protein
MAALPSASLPYDRSSACCPTIPPAPPRFAGIGRASASVQPVCRDSDSCIIFKPAQKYRLLDFVNFGYLHRFHFRHAVLALEPRCLGQRWVAQGFCSSHMPSCTSVHNISNNHHLPTHPLAVIFHPLPFIHNGTARRCRQPHCRSEQRN